MKNILIIGSSGMIGSLILQKCLAHHEVQTNHFPIVRRRSLHNHPKLAEIEHTDFMDFHSVEDYFKNIDCCFFLRGCCIQER